jgi:hypothetical protein
MGKGTVYFPAILKPVPVPVMQPVEHEIEFTSAGSKDLTGEPAVRDSYTISRAWPARLTRSGIRLIR